MCNSLLKNSEFLNFFTGGKPLFRDKVATSINKNHLSSFVDLLGLDWEEASFPSFLPLRAFEFAKGDNLDWVNEKMTLIRDG